MSSEKPKEVVVEKYILCRQDGTVSPKKVAMLAKDGSIIDYADPLAFKYFVPYSVGSWSYIELLYYFMERIGRNDPLTDEEMSLIVVEPMILMEATESGFGLLKGCSYFQMETKEYAFVISKSGDELGWIPKDYFQ